MPRRFRAPAAPALALLLAVGAVGACSDDSGDAADDGGTTTSAPPATGDAAGDSDGSTTTGPPSTAGDSTATTAAPTDGGRDDPTEASVDDELATRVVGAIREQLPPMTEVDDATFADLFTRTCSTVVTGAGTDAGATAEAIAADLPPGPDFPQYVPGMLLAAQFYLSEGDCGGDAAFAQSVREALGPITSEAFIEHVGGGG